MAVSTIKATIQMRHGLERDFDGDQMTAGEWAVSIDLKYVRMCFAPGIVIRMATYEAFEQDMKEIQTILAECRDIQLAVDAMADLAEKHKADAENYAKLSESWARGGTGIREGEDSDSSLYWSQQSKIEADRAKSEADRASAIAGTDVDSELSETSANPVQNKVITKALKEVSVDISNEEVTFDEAEKRSNIQSGEKIPVLFGKIKKWYSDLKAVAFTGNYNDLNEKPTIPTELKNPKALTFTGNSKESYDGSLEKTVHIPSGVNSLLVTEGGYWLDARQGKVLNDKIADLKNNTGGLNFKIYEVDPRTWDKGSNEALDIDVPYENIRYISAMFFNASVRYIMPVTAINTYGDYAASYAVDMNVRKSDNKLIVRCGGQWSGYGLQVIVGYV